MLFQIVSSFANQVVIHLPRILHHSANTKWSTACLFWVNRKTGDKNGGIDFLFHSCLIIALCGTWQLHDFCCKLSLCCHLHMVNLCFFHFWISLYLGKWSVISITNLYTPTAILTILSPTLSLVGLCSILESQSPHCIYYDDDSFRTCASEIYSFFLNCGFPSDIENHLHFIQGGSQVEMVESFNVPRHKYRQQFVLNQPHWKSPQKTREVLYVFVTTLTNFYNCYCWKHPIGMHQYLLRNWKELWMQSSSSHKPASPHPCPPPLSTPFTLHTALGK